ncbi:MAG: hypothetical protein LBT97_12720 [Planctomycetota bacterium]|jgi:L-fucose isomerase|nr:hypothetical protein [Planctomycetota bacterium]
MATAKNLGEGKPGKIKAPVIGVFATNDPRIDKSFWERGKNIVKMAADIIAKNVKLPDGGAPQVVYTPTQVMEEKSADIAARQLLDAGANILVCVPDAWCFPQPTLLSFLAHFPKQTPLNITCGNSATLPGVVFAQATLGALAQSGIMAHLNVGTWPDVGQNPVMTKGTADALIDWCQAAVTVVGLRGRRVVVFGHDSMGMETALAHILPTRRTFGLEITRLDMKLLADMLAKKSYKPAEQKAMRAWVDKHIGKRLAARTKRESENFNQSIALYLVTRDLMADLNAVGGGFMAQLEWNSDRRGIPLPGPDFMESVFNSSFDHNGRKEPLPYATEADTQGLLTMLAMTWLSAGNPPLFMDFRKVWEPWEIQGLADKVGVSYGADDVWAQKGFVDGVNSGAASFDWAGLPGWKPEQILKNIGLPAVDPDYFPGGGNSVTFVTPGGIEGIAGRLAYSYPADRFTMFWDEAATTEMIPKLSEAVRKTSAYDWPHTWVVPKYATMYEYKHYAPANHLHMIRGLKPARLQFWMDMTNVLSGTPWAARPAFIEGVDRPQPLPHLLNGGEVNAKFLLGG